MSRSKRLRQKRRREERAAMKAAQSVRAAEAASNAASRPAKDPLTDISALRVSVSDVMAAGVRTEPMRWAVSYTHLRAHET